MDFPEDLEFDQILIELMSHLPKTRDVIQIIVAELKRDSILNWENIRLFLSDLYKYHLQSSNPHLSSNIDKFVKFIFRVLTVFDTHKCFDISVIADVLELLCLLNFSKTGAYRKALSMGNAMNNNSGQKYISTFEQMLVTSYKDIPSLFNAVGPSLNWNWVQFFTSHGKVDILKAIISFGVTLIVPKDSPYDYNYVYSAMVMLFNLRAVTVDEIFGYRFEQNFRSELNESSRKRFYFINTVLRILLMRDSYFETDEYIKCARIFVETTPEPFITSKEIKSLFTNLCSGINCNEKLLLQFLEKYETYFPESREDPTPRSLRHLSRFQVRESLRTARSFPCGVESLPVPKKIQDYIRFKDILL